MGLMWADKGNYGPVKKMQREVKLTFISES